jgi:hypothetical protein
MRHVNYNVPQVARHDGISLRGHRQLDEMVVGFIRQIRPPGLEHFDPAIAIHQTIERSSSFLGRQRGIGKQL